VRKRWRYCSYMENNTADLMETRKTLARTEADLYTDAFPGSKPWLRHNAAFKALCDFDKAHPEIAESCKAEAEAARKARYDDLSDFAKGGF